MLTERQASALEAALTPHCDAKCFIAMRYWHPLSEETATQVNAWGAPELVLLPLYPQYSFATTSSSLKEWKRVFHPNGSAPRAHTVETFYDNPLYVQAVAEKISLTLTHFDEPDRAHLAFRAKWDAGNGLPLRLRTRSSSSPARAKKILSSSPSRSSPSTSKPSTKLISKPANRHTSWASSNLR